MIPKVGSLVRVTYDDGWETRYKYGVVVKANTIRVWAWWQGSKPKAYEKYNSLEKKYFNTPEKHPWLGNYHPSRVDILSIQSWKNRMEALL